MPAGMKKAFAALLSLAFLAGVALHDGAHAAPDSKTCGACGVGHSVIVAAGAPRISQPLAPAGEARDAAESAPASAGVRLLACRGPPAA
jgi:hypothetical protein